MTPRRVPALRTRYQNSGPPASRTLISSGGAEILPERPKGLRVLQFTPAYCLRV